MMAVNHIVTAVILCFSAHCCEAWTLKRQSHSECAYRTDPCILNTRIVMELFNGNGFDRLVVNDHLALQCSAPVRENTGRCVSENTDCISSFMVDRLVAGYQYMCDQEGEFVEAASCWNSVSIAETVTRCEDDSSGTSCSMSTCLKREIPKIYGCTHQAASLFTNVVQAVLRSAC